MILLCCASELGLPEDLSTIEVILYYIIIFQDLASNPSEIDLIIMDVSKAFDKVPHRRLDYKLDWYGIRGNTREWILDFLSSRSQRVVLEGA